MIIAIPKETHPDDPRVALIPAAIPGLIKAEHEVRVQQGAGVPSGYPDAEYQAKGAQIVADRHELLQSADIVLQVRTPGTNPDLAETDLNGYRSGQTVIGFANPFMAREQTEAVASRGVRLYAMELMPRITRAQSMDALSAMASIAGYKAVLMAADRLPKFFPMMMTAAGTITPARIFVLGAGVAGLQAIATARRLGAVVQAYDIRAATRDQVESVGGKFVAMPDETTDAEGAGGYAKVMGEEFNKRQRAFLADYVAESDVVITTAAIPGRPAPLLVTTEAVSRMRPGSVVIDLAAETGGNCELTELGQTVHHEGVTVLGPANLPGTVPFHASQMYAKNISTFALHLDKVGVLADSEVDVSEDEIARDTLVTRDGQVVHPKVRDVYGLEALPVDQPAAQESPS